MHSSGHGVQSKDSFESVGSAGTPDADVSDLSKPKGAASDSESKRRTSSQRKGSSASAQSGRNNHYHNVDHHRHGAKHKGGTPATIAAGPGAQKPHHPKWKGAPHALPGSRSAEEQDGEEGDVLRPEHEYEDIPDQSDDESKEDRWAPEEKEAEEGRRRRRTGSSLGAELDEQDEEEREREESLLAGTTNSNDTRTLTQQCSLVAPNEVHITESPALIAEPVLSESGALRGLVLCGARQPFVCFADFRLR